MPSMKARPLLVPFSQPEQKGQQDSSVMFTTFRVKHTARDSKFYVQNIPEIQRSQQMRCVDVHQYVMCLSRLESIAESRNASATSITAGRSSDGRRWTWSASEWSVKFFKTYFQCNLNSVSYNSYFSPSNSGTSWMSYLNKNAM